MAEASKDATAGGYKLVADSAEDTAAVAANTKPQAERTTNEIKVDDMADCTACNSQSENDPAGLKSFFDFDTDLSEQDAEQLKRELKAEVPAMPDLAIDVFQATHHILREHKLANGLNLDHLVYFLATCNDNIPSVNIGEDVMKQEVERALKSAQLFIACKDSVVSPDYEPIDFHVLFSGIDATVAQVNIMRVTELHGIELEYHTVVKNELRRMSCQEGQAAGLLRANEQEEHSLIREYNEISEKLSMLREQVGEFLAMHG